MSVLNLSCQSYLPPFLQPYGHKPYWMIRTSCYEWLTFSKENNRIYDLKIEEPGSLITGADLSSLRLVLNWSPILALEKAVIAWVSDRPNELDSLIRLPYSLLVAFSILTSSSRRELISLSWSTLYLEEADLLTRCYEWLRREDSLGIFWILLEDFLTGESPQCTSFIICFFDYMTATWDNANEAVLWN